MVPKADDFSSAFQDHLRAPRNLGRVPKPDGIGVAENPACGDELRVTIRVHAGLVEQAKFEASGCAATLSAGSLVTEMVRGLTLEAVATTITTEVVDTALGNLPPLRRHAAGLASLAVRRAALDALQRATPR